MIHVTRNLVVSFLKCFLFNNARILLQCTVHDLRRCIGSRNPTRHSVPNYVRLTYLSVYENRADASETTVSPSPPSSFTHVHKCIGSRHPTRYSVSKYVRLTYLLTHVHNIQSHTLLTPTFLTFMCTQVLWCLARLTRSGASGVTMDPDIRITILSTHGTQCIRGV